jgi:hypothetical protein
VAIDKHAWRQWRRQVRDILNREWDPIGGCPEDEYDAYAGKIAAMIRDAATDEQLLTYLEWAEVEHMGLGQPFGRERANKVITSLRALGSPP